MAAYLLFPVDVPHSLCLFLAFPPMYVNLSVFLQTTRICGDGKKLIPPHESVEEVNISSVTPVTVPALTHDLGIQISTDLKCIRPTVEYPRISVTYAFRVGN